LRCLGFGRSAGFGGRRGSHCCVCRRRASGVWYSRVGAKVDVSSRDVAFCACALRRADRPFLMAVVNKVKTARQKCGMA
jgi:hypothetical protein